MRSGENVPNSVIIPATSLFGVMSNAGFQQCTPCGAIRIHKNRNKDELE
jgi:hypothetical protein